jgi:hypothetical protein
VFQSKDEQALIIPRVKKQLRQGDPHYLVKSPLLLAKSQHNGCTEAEALAAAELVQKLMDKYGLSLAELQEISSPADACEVDVTPIGKRRAHEEVLHRIRPTNYTVDDARR